MHWCELGVMRYGVKSHWCELGVMLIASHVALVGTRRYVNRIGVN